MRLDTILEKNVHLIVALALALAVLMSMSLFIRSGFGNVASASGDQAVVGNRDQAAVEGDSLYFSRNSANGGSEKIDGSTAARANAALDANIRTALPSDAIAAGEGETGRELGTGEASFYGIELAGRPTANGETFDPADLTAAHRTLPFGSRVRVTNAHNGRSVVVRINDRGPFVEDRLIDVSKGAAQQLGMVQSGTARVVLELL